MSWSESGLARHRRGTDARSATIKRRERQGAAGGAGRRIGEVQTNSAQFESAFDVSARLASGTGLSRAWLLDMMRPA